MTISHRGLQHPSSGINVYAYVVMTGLVSSILTSTMQPPKNVRNRSNSIYNNKRTRFGEGAFDISKVSEQLMHSIAILASSEAQSHIACLRVRMTHRKVV